MRTFTSSTGHGDTETRRRPTSFSPCLRASVACFIIVALAAAPVAAAEIERDTRIVIRTYDSADIRAADITSAMETAMAILSAAGLDVEWLACAVAGFKDRVSSPERAAGA